MSPKLFVVKYSLAILLAGISLCAKAQTKVSKPKGQWQGMLALDADTVYFKLNFDQASQPMLINGSDRQPLYYKADRKDSLVLGMHIYDAEIVFKQQQSTLRGFYIKHDAASGPYRLPFWAELEKKPLPCTSSQPHDLTGEWQLAIHQVQDNKTTTALGIIKQNGCALSGTILTPSGDYRFLNGVIHQNKFHISGFDGAFTIAFKGELRHRDTMVATLKSTKGKTNHVIGYRVGIDKKIPAAKSIDFDKGAVVNIALPDADGNMIRLSDAPFQQKIVLLQIMGSWCPNCLDEATYLNQWIKKQPDVAIIGLAFERKDDPAYAFERINSFKKRLKIDYPIVFAGKNDKAAVLKTLPALHDFGAYPTLLYLDKQHRLQYVHAGFSGPATGAYFEQWKVELEEKINLLRKVE